MTYWQFAIAAVVLLFAGAFFWRVLFRPWPIERRTVPPLPPPNCAAGRWRNLAAERRDRIARRVQGRMGDE